MDRIFIIHIEKKLKFFFFSMRETLKKILLELLTQEIADTENKEFRKYTWFIPKWSFTSD